MKKTKNRYLKGGLPFVYPEGWHRHPNMKVDLDLLHLYLWKNTDMYGRLKLTLQDVADWLGLTRPRMKKYLVKMHAEKRVKDFGGTLVVADPTLWVFNRNVLDTVETGPGPRRRKR